MKVNIHDYLPKYNIPEMSNRVCFWNLGKQLIKNELENIIADKVQAMKSFQIGIKTAIYYHKNKIFNRCFAKV